MERNFNDVLDKIKRVVPSSDEAEVLFEAGCEISRLRAEISTLSNENSFLRNEVRLDKDQINVNRNPARGNIHI